MPKRKNYVSMIGGRHKLSRLETDFGEVLGYAQAIIDIGATGTLAEGATNVAFEIPIPDNAILMDGIVEVVTAFTGEGPDTGVTMSLGVEAAGDILSATANSSLTAGALLDVTPDGTATNMIKTTAEQKNVIVTIDDPDGTNGMDAGKAHVWLRFVVTE